jgi:hypothetical protein
MPPRAFEFATAEWHYDPEDHRCPHDAWVKSLIVSERASGSRQERRSLEVELTLLGAYHDGVLTLTYCGVRQYSLFQPPVNQQAEVAHGDWLVDEVEVADASRPEAPLVVHHILFSGRGVWTIEAQDILCEWRT